VEEVKLLHDLSIERYGGSYGIRDEGLLKSAVSMPRQEFGGQFLHPTLAAMAAAYLFHLCQNHPFVDGNKRAALLAGEAFLRLNGKELGFTNQEAEEITLRVAAGELPKGELTRLLEGRIQDLRNE
jgi:death-on-curing protein